MDDIAAIVNFSLEKWIYYAWSRGPRKTSGPTNELFRMDDFVFAEVIETSRPWQ